MSVSTTNKTVNDVYLFSKRYYIGENVNVVFSKQDQIYKDYGLSFQVLNNVYLQRVDNGRVIIYDKSRDISIDIDIRHITDIYPNRDKCKIVSVIPMYKSIILSCFELFKSEFYHLNISRLVICDNGSKISPKFLISAYLEDNYKPNNDLVYLPLTKKFIYQGMEYKGLKQKSVLDLFAEVVNTCSKGYSVSSINIYMCSGDCVVYMYDRDNRVFYDVKFLK